jgi:plasmid stability protein
MARTTKTLTVSLPPDWYDELEEMASREHKSKSQLFREMMLAHRESSAGRDHGPAAGSLENRMRGASIVAEDTLTGLMAPTTLGRLAMRARAHGRSVEDEVKVILEEVTGGDMARAREAARRAQERTRGRISGDSAKLIAEDRRR